MEINEETEGVLSIVPMIMNLINQAKTPICTGQQVQLLYP